MYTSLAAFQGLLRYPNTKQQLQTARRIMLTGSSDTSCTLSSTSAIGGTLRLPLP